MEEVREVTKFRGLRRSPNHFKFVLVVVMLQSIIKAILINTFIYF